MRKIPNFDDRIIKCRKCGKIVGKQVLQGQCLIIESSGIGVWSLLRWQCIRCGKNNSWQSPHLEDEQSFAVKYPDCALDVKPPKNLKLKI